MQKPDVIWRFGQWIADRKTGEVRLTAPEIDLVIGLVDGKVIALRGLDPSILATRLGVERTGRDDLLEEATELAKRHSLHASQVVSIAKEVLQDVVAQWMRSDDRNAEVREADLAVDGRPTISLTHALVEMMLSDPEAELADIVLPDHDVLLQRSDDFLELYSPLRLSEEADLIVSKVTGQRTAGEIAERSSAIPSEVMNLLAALVATGMLRPKYLERADLEPDSAKVAFQEPERVRRQIPLWTMLAALAGVLLVIVLLATWWNRPQTGEDVAEAPAGSEWVLVVDMGCEPQDLQRILRKVGEHPNTLKIFPTDAGDGGRCWRLAWGQFPSRQSADEAVSQIPEKILTSGFDPHPIELPEEVVDAPLPEVED
jgi:hypothetical protein